jgi:predicted metal-dependent enzyme (double-stranded beta helix superfamily)
MNKIDFAKINKKEDMIMVFNQLKDDYSIAFQQITQLTNNWNELEEWIMQDVKDEKPDLYFQVLRKVDILDKMKEIKERKNENI